MRKSVCLGAALALPASLACAADLPSHKAPPIYVPPPPVFTWTGPYVGANAGGTIGDSEFADPMPLNGGGFLGGLGGGYNWQWSPNFVVGLETDIGYRSQIGGGNNALANVSGSLDGYLGTFRARLGYSIDRWLIYATGGLAYGNVIAPKTFTGWGVIGPGFAVGARKDHNDTLLPGWTVGAGVEYALNNNWSIKAEYLYARLAHMSPLYLTNISPLPVGVCNTSALHVIRAGVNYHFNFSDPAPIIAKF